MKQYITFLLCLFTIITYSQDKKVHFAHGLGGDDSSWAEFSAELEADCPGIETTLFQSNSTDGIDVYSGSLFGQLTFHDADADDIAIGHSFGGINLRYLDSKNTGLFGGYITVGSVHGGANISTSYLNGNFNAWLNQTCKEVVTDPAEALYDLTFLSIALPNLVSSKKSEFMCNQIYDKIIEDADGFIGNGVSIDELQIGGRISNLPAATLPAVSIVCSTETHPLWSLMSGAEDNAFDLTYGNIDYFDYADFIQDGSLSAGNFFSVLANISSINPFNFFATRKLRKASKEFKDSYNWMMGTEATWNELIGAGGGVTWITYETETWICDCYNVNTGQPTPCGSNGLADEITIYDIDPASTCADDDAACWQSTIVTIPNFGPDLPSDGLIPVDKQTLPGSIHEERIYNVSHFEETEDAGVKASLMKQLKEDSAPHQIFIINQCS